MGDIGGTNMLRGLEVKSLQNTVFYRGNVRKLGIYNGMQDFIHLLQGLTL